MFHTMNWWRNKNSEARKRREKARENGKVLLKELIKCCDGKSNPIKTFSAKQILTATSNFSFNNTYAFGGYPYHCHKGMLDDRVVLIKNTIYSEIIGRDQICRDIAISSMVSGHNNFPKLLGCCLEFTCPVLVYEYPGVILREVRPLEGTNGLDSTLTWDLKIKIAKEIAYAVAYLHTGFPRTIIHRDIHPCNVFLDCNGTAKLSNFYCSVSIPQGETFVKVDNASGVYCYMDPNFMKTRKVTENTDVYAFGVFMLLLLTGRGRHWRLDKLFPCSPDKMIEDGRVLETVDPKMLERMGDKAEEERWRVEAFLVLALRCVGHRGEVPKMLEVAKELKRIELRDLIRK